MPGYDNIRMTAVSEHQARVSATGILLAKYIEMYDGNQEPIFESINTLMAGPADQIGGVLLTVVNLLTAFISENGQNERQFKDFCDFLVKSLADDTPQVSRMMG